MPAQMEERDHFPIAARSPVLVARLTQRVP